MSHYFLLVFLIFYFLSQQIWLQCFVCSGCARCGSFTYMHIICAPSDPFLTWVRTQCWVVFSWYSVGLWCLYTSHVLVYLCFQNMLIYPVLKPFHLVNHTFVDRIFDCLALWIIFIGINFQVTALSDIIGYVSFAFWLTSCCDYLQTHLWCCKRHCFSFFLGYCSICPCTSSSFPFIFGWTFW